MAFISAIVAAIGLTGTAAAVATFVGKAILSFSVSKLLANRANKNATGTMPSGSRQQLPPATDNKLPVIYGTGFIGPSITDAKISTDQKTMWYCCSFAEVTDTTAGSAYTFDEIYYDNKLVTFGTGGDAAKVVSLTTNGVTPQVDTKINGSLYIYLFTNGSSSGVNTGGQTAIQILSDTDIPSDLRWNSALYTDNGQSADMTNTCFAIVKVIYNQDAGTTSLGTLKAKITNSLTKPGSVIKDYLLNTRYGCAVSIGQIDTTSLTALDTYSDGLIDYTDVNGNPQTQVRYRINGPVDTGTNCLDNLQQLVDACDSWLQYSELTGQWKVVINQSYTDYTSFANLFSANDENIVGAIDVNPVDLNGTFNQLEIQYPNTNIQDQIDNCYVDLFTEYPTLLNANEPINKLTVQFSIVNNFVQAKYLGIRRLLQSREDLIITFAIDYSGIVIEAGDVIKVTNSTYGWTDKLFRVSNVNEEKYIDGNLGVKLTAFEYNDSIYDNDLDITDFVPEANTGLADPNIIGTPNPPIATIDLANTIALITVTGTVPNTGIITNFDFNYGNSNNAISHRYYTSISGNGLPLAGNSNISINVTDIPTGNWYWSVTARNQFVGVRSNSNANSYTANWPGPTVTSYNSNANTGGIISNNIASNAVTFAKINPDSSVLSLVSAVGFDVRGANGNATINPVPISNANVNVPVYLNGTTVLSNQYFPYYQNTATTSLGYIANSTAAWTPGNSAVLNIYNGDDNWWAFLLNTYTTIPANTYYIVDNLSCALVSNANTKIQIASFSYDANTGVIASGTYFSTYELTANLPQKIEETSQYTNNYGAEGSGFMIRNMDANTQVIIFSGGMTTSIGKL